MPSEIIAIKKVLNSVLGSDVSAKYMQKPDSGLYDGNAIYQAALTHLLSGKTEKAIIHIIHGLDADRQNLQLLHLSKTMLLSVSEYLYENNSEVYRQKYPDLGKAEAELQKNIKNYDDELSDSENRLDKLSKELVASKPTFFSFRPYTLYYFKSKKMKKEIEKLESDISDYRDEIAEMKKDLKSIGPLVKVDEYSKVLGLIIEVCTFPTRYEWVLSKK